MPPTNRKPLTQAESEAVSALVRHCQDVETLARVSSYRTDALSGSGPHLPALDDLIDIMEERTQLAGPFIEVLRSRIIPRPRKAGRTTAKVASVYGPKDLLTGRIGQLAAVAGLAWAFIDEEVDPTATEDETLRDLSAQIELMRSIMGEIDALEEKVLRAAAGKGAAKKAA